MKNEKKFLYVLTRREAHAAQDACNRITADLPENLGVSNAQFEACDRCLLYTSPSPRDRTRSRMPSSA